MEVIINGKKHLQIVEVDSSPLTTKSGELIFCKNHRLD